MPTVSKRVRYADSAASSWTVSSVPSNSRNASANGGPMNLSSSWGGGEERPRLVSACWMHRTMPWRGSVSVPSRSMKILRTNASSGRSPLRSLGQEVPVTQELDYVPGDRVRLDDQGVGDRHGDEVRHASELEIGRAS